MHTLKYNCLRGLLALSLILGSWRGYVALFEAGKDTPRQIYPYKVCTLPQADQDAITEGIPVRSEKQLAHLLEDYLS